MAVMFIRYSVLLYALAPLTSALFNCLTRISISACNVKLYVGISTTLYIVKHYHEDCIFRLLMSKELEVHILLRQVCIYIQCMVPA